MYNINAECYVKIKSGMFINKHNIRITYNIKTKEYNAAPEVALTMDGCTKNKPSASNIPVGPCPQPNVPTEQADV